MLVASFVNGDFRVRTYCNQIFFFGTLDYFVECSDLSFLKYYLCGIFSVWFHFVDVFTVLYSLKIT